MNGEKIIGIYFIVTLRLNQKIESMKMSLD